MPADAAPIELDRPLERIVKGRAGPYRRACVSSGPILENVKTGDEIDMTIFPTPHWHELDGGRYIGTADCVITGEPEEGGWVNVGIYRVQVHDKNTLGLYVSPGHHARIMREKYWEKGKSCPVVVTFGQDPLLFLVAGQSIALRHVRARLLRRLARRSRGRHSRRDYRFADSGDGRDRHRRRSAAAPGAGAHGRSVRRMAGLLRPWRGQRAGDPGQKTLLSQRPDSCAARRR